MTRGSLIAIGILKTAGKGEAVESAVRGAIGAGKRIIGGGADIGGGLARGFGAAQGGLAETAGRVVGGAAPIVGAAEGGRRVKRRADAKIVQFQMRHGLGPYSSGYYAQ